MNKIKNVLLLAIMIIGLVYVIPPASSISGNISHVDYPSHIALDTTYTITAKVNYNNVPRDWNIEVTAHFENPHTQERYQIFPDPEYFYFYWMEDHRTEYSGSRTFTFTMNLISWYGFPAGLKVVDLVITASCGENRPWSTAEWYDRQSFALTVLEEMPELEISNIQYVKPPDTVRASETTPVVVETRYSGFYDPMTLAADIFELATGAYLGGQVSVEQVSGSGTYIFRPIEITARPMAIDEWDLRVEVIAESAGSTIGFGEEIIAVTQQEITIIVEAPPAHPPRVHISTIDYPKPPETIVIGEWPLIKVTIEYSDLAPNTLLALWFEDLDTGQGLTPYTPSIYLEGSGTYTFPQESLPNISGAHPDAFDWHIRANIDLINYDITHERIVEKEFMIKVVAQEGESQVEITSIQYVKPPETIAIGESTSVLVEVQYQNLIPNTKIGLYIREVAGTHLNLNSVEISTPLEGVGTYTFPQIIITPSAAGNWNLYAYVYAYSHGSFTDTEEFTIKVVTVGGPSEAPPPLQITGINYVRSPDTIAIGEPTPVMVRVQYQNLAPGTILKLHIIDEDTQMTVAPSTASPPLQGSGTYTFPNVVITPSQAGNWRLRLQVGEQGGELVNEMIVIKVVSIEGPPVGVEARARITGINYVKRPDVITVGESTPVMVRVQYQNLAPGTILDLYIKDEATSRRVGSTASPPLQGSGTYTFPNVVITPSQAGNWRLKVRVVSQDGELASKEITIKVE